jgi:hypothetical protein
MIQSLCQGCWLSIQLMATEQLRAGGGVRVTGYSPFEPLRVNQQR